MKINDEVFIALTGSTGITQYVSSDYIYKEFLPENFQNDSIVFATDIIGRRQELDGTVWAYDYNIIIVLFMQNEANLELLHDQVVDLFKDYCSSTIQGIELESDSFEFDPDLRLNVAEITFSTVYHV